MGFLWEFYGFFRDFGRMWGFGGFCYVGFLGKGAGEGIWGKEWWGWGSMLIFIANFLWETLVP